MHIPTHKDSRRIHFILPIYKLKTITSTKNLSYSFSFEVANFNFPQSFDLTVVEKFLPSLNSISKMHHNRFDALKNKIPIATSKQVLFASLGNKNTIHQVLFFSIASAL